MFPIIWNVAAISLYFVRRLSNFSPTFTTFGVFLHIASVIYTSEKNKNCQINRHLTISSRKVSLPRFLSSHRILDSIPANVFSFVKNSQNNDQASVWFLLPGEGAQLCGEEGGHDQSEKCPNYSKFRRG